MKHTIRSMGNKCELPPQDGQSGLRSLHSKQNKFLAGRKALVTLLGVSIGVALAAPYEANNSLDHHDEAKGKTLQSLGFLATGLTFLEGAGIIFFQEEIDKIDKKIATFNEQKRI